VGLLSREIHCTTCNFEGNAKTIHKGSLAVEIALWLCFLAPGFIYTIWRMTAGKYSGCPQCKSERVVDLKKWNERASNRAA